MRRAPAEYLESAKIEELAEELQESGYRVEREATVANQVFDILAQRGDERLVFEVKARSRLKESIDEVAQLRQAAFEARVSGFRLVVVTPPRATEVTIEGLESELTHYLVDNPPPTLDEMFSNPRVERATDIEIESAAVRHDGIDVRGRATVNLEVDFGGRPTVDNYRVSDALSFTFDVALGPDLKLAMVHDLKVDIGDYANVGE
jgi:Holliday junction resolvase